MFVPGSRRYSDPAAYLLTPSKWADQRVEFCQLVGKPADAVDALAEVEDELHTALGSWKPRSPRATARSAWTRPAIW